MPTLSEIQIYSDITSKLVTPFLLALLGLILIRKVERAKAVVTRASEQKKKWADTFYDASQAFAQGCERFMSVVHHYSSNQSPDIKKKLLNEIWDLTVLNGELAMRIERLAASAPATGSTTSGRAKTVQQCLEQVLAPGGSVNVDKAKKLLAELSEAMLATHRELLELQDA